MNNMDYVEVFRALGDETRLEVVRKLAKTSEPVSNCDIVCACSSLSSLSQPTASHHLAKLVNAGLVFEKKSGTQKIYSLNKKLFARVGLDINKL